MRTSLKHSIYNIAPDQVTLRLYLEKQETNINKICDRYLRSINLKERALILNGNECHFPLEGTPEVTYSSSLHCW